VRARRSCEWRAERASIRLASEYGTVPAGFVLLDGASPARAFTGAALIFLLLFVFLPKIIRYAMKADTETIFIAFGKNEQVKKCVLEHLRRARRMVLAGTIDPAIVQTIVEAILPEGG
jgi:hypothetical protein